MQSERRPEHNVIVTAGPEWTKRTTLTQVFGASARLRWCVRWSTAGRQSRRPIKCAGSRCLRAPVAHRTGQFVVNECNGSPIADCRDDGIDHLSFLAWLFHNGHFLNAEQWFGWKLEILFSRFLFWSVFLDSSRLCSHLWSLTILICIHFVYHQQLFSSLVDKFTSSRKLRAIDEETCFTENMGTFSADCR